MTMTRPQGGGAADGAERKLPPKPLPLQENKALTDPFWQAAKRHELVMQRCTKCANWIHFPREQCPVCFSQQTEWAPVSGKGRVYAFTNVHQSQHPAFQEDTPYCFAIVQLDEGPRMVTNIVDIAPENVQCDMPVVATYDDVSDDWTLVKFKPA
jgi:uncharacterized OB-fold protein